MKLLSLGLSCLLSVAIGQEKLVATEQCLDTDCPQGCCQEVGWFCCSNSFYCAVTEAECENVELEEMFGAGECPGFMCPDGCCPKGGWECCHSDNIWPCAQKNVYEHILETI